MSDRERILSAVRGAVGLKDEAMRATLPDIPIDELISARRNAGGGTWETFRRNFEAVNGDYLDSEDALRELLRRESVKKCYCPPELFDRIHGVVPESTEIAIEFIRDEMETYQAGFTMASWAVAETGTLVLEDRHTPNRLGALAPWAHIALVRKDQLLATVAEAIGKLSSDPNIVWVTGPSKTADVEGILIEGVHGPGVQACWVID